MKRGKSIISVLLIGVLVFCMMPSVRADEIEDKKDEVAEAEEEKVELSKKLEAVIAETKEAEEALIKKQTEIIQAADELDRARVKEQDQYVRMKKRIKYMYENGDAEIIEIICNATSIADLLNRAEYIKKISEYDRQTLVDFQELIKEIEIKEAALKQEEADLKILQDNLISKQADLNALLEIKSSEIASLESEIRRLIKEAEEAARRQKEAEEAAAAEAARQAGLGTPGGSVVVGNGTLSNPCPTGRLTSNYGWRPIPTPGATANHFGVDIGASSGTPVYAASDGSVTTVSYNSGRGNYIIVNHGDGMQTLYQHLSQSYVSVGQSVTRGQNIAAVGSTGVSTGPHLHFEVHVNGSPVNPMGYL